MSRHSKWLIGTAAAAVAIYATLWLGFAFHWQWLATADSAMLHPLHNYGVKHPAWLRFWNVLCAVLSPESFRLVGAAIALVAVARRNLRAAVFLLAAVVSSGIVSQVAKYLADRPRPVGALETPASTAFPSGHALAAMATALALLTISGAFSRRGRVVAIVLGAVMVIAVGVGRVALNVHYPSDVVAGWVLGYLWYLGCLLVTRPLPLIAEDRTREAPDTGC